MKKRFAYLIIIIFLCAFTACSNMSTQTAVVEASASETASSQITVTPSITTALALAPTSTSTIARTPTPTIPTFTPQPIETITSSKAMKLMDILSGSPECQPPCWNGITPGISHDWEIPNFFARLGVDVENLEVLKWPNGTTISVPEEKLPSSIYKAFMPDNISVYSIDGKVNSISINRMKYTDLYTPEIQFKMLGNPSEIKYGYIYDGYWLYLNYPEKHTAVLISGMLNQVVDQGKILKDELCITPNDNRISITIYLYSPSADEYNYQGFNAGWVDFHKDLGIGFDELIDALNHSDPCISVLQ